MIQPPNTGGQASWQQAPGPTKCASYPPPPDPKTHEQIPYPTRQAPSLEFKAEEFKSNIRNIATRQIVWAFLSMPGFQQTLEYIMSLHASLLFSMLFLCMTVITLPIPFLLPCSLLVEFSPSLSRHIIQETSPLQCGHPQIPCYSFWNRQRLSHVLKTTDIQYMLGDNAVLSIGEILLAQLLNGVHN